MGVLGLVGLVLAAGSTSFDGAVTAGALLHTEGDAGDATAVAHLRVDVARDFGRYFAEARASVLLLGPSTLTTFTGIPILLRDLGSQLTVGYRPSPLTRVALEFRPLDSSLRFPALDWANAWGLSVAYAPMVTALVSTEHASAWLSARFEQGQTRDRRLRVFPTVLAGFETALPAGLRLELRAAFLQAKPSRQQLFLRDEKPLRAAGGGARLSWTWGEAVGPPIDLVVYASDPLRFERFFVSEARRTRRAVWLALEGGVVAQERLAAFSDWTREVQTGWWFDAQARVRLGALRLFATLRARPLLMYLLDQSLVGEVTIPPMLANGPTVSGLLGVDYTFRSSRLTPGLLVNLTQPAWFEGLFFPSSVGIAPAPRTNRYLLSPGQLGVARSDTVAPLLAVKFSLRWEVNSLAALVSELEFLQDFNQVSDGTPLGERGRPLSVRAQLFAQLRF